MISVIAYMLAGAISFTGYHLGIKAYSANRLIAVLWINVLCAIILFFALRVFDTHIFDLTPTLWEFIKRDFPLHVVAAAVLVASRIIFIELINRYEISLVMLVCQASIIFKAIGYLLLGNPFRIPSMIAIFLVLLGVCISSLKNFNISNIAQEITLPLLLGGIVSGGLLALQYIIIFLSTNDTLITQTVIAELSHMSSFHFSYMDPVVFKDHIFLASAFFYGLYILFTYKKPQKILTQAGQYAIPITLLSLLYLGAMVSYMHAFSITHDKLLIAALNKLELVFLVITSRIFLHEAITTTKVTGLTLIILGNFIGIAF